MITTMEESEGDGDEVTPPVAVDEVGAQSDDEEVAECLLTSQVDFQ